MVSDGAPEVSGAPDVVTSCGGTVVLASATAAVVGATDSSVVRPLVTDGALAAEGATGVDPPCGSTVVLSPAMLVTRLVVASPSAGASEVAPVAVSLPTGTTGASTIASVVAAEVCSTVDAAADPVVASAPTVLSLMIEGVSEVACPVGVTASTVDGALVLPVMIVARFSGATVDAVAVAPTSATVEVKTTLSVSAVASVVVGPTSTAVAASVGSLGVADVTSMAAVAADEDASSSG